MKSFCYGGLFFILTLFIASPIAAQAPVWSESIRATNIDVRTAPVALAQITIDVPENGSVLVNFDGNAIPDVGDRMVLAASDTESWLPNDGAVGFEAVDSDVNKQSFSHTRMYPVTPGEHTFYAVAHNWVEQDGSGMASIYGNLTVKYFAASGDAAAYHKGIQQTSVNVRGNPVVMAEQTIETTEVGSVLVRFDGYCIPDFGDRIALAASSTPDWSPNDGNTSCQAASADVNQSVFSHSRMYRVDAGTHTFYAVAENWVSQVASGIASVYGSLTVEFYPNRELGPFISQEGIAETNIDVRTSTVTLAQMSVDAPLPGKVIVHFDGTGIPDDGDRLVLAASDTPNWSANEGNVNFELSGGNRNTVSFSHTQVYDIDFGGTYDFYALANNGVEEDGDGLASIYASMTVQYFPDLSRVSNEDAPELAGETFILQQNYPNPFEQSTSIRYTLNRPASTTLTIYDLLGKEVKTLATQIEPTGSYEITWDGADLNGRPVPSGVYIYRFQAGNTVQSRRMTVVR